MEKIVLVDGHSILHRAFYGIPELTNANGLHTNAVYGFLNILFKVLEEENPDYVAVAFDVSAPTFRHEMFEQYKGTRKPMPEELREQVPVMKEVLCAMGILVVEQPGYEADDLLGTMAAKSEKKGLQVSVISGDRDLLQLATNMVKIRIPKTKRTGTEVEDYYKDQVIEKYKVTPQEFIEVKALMGDTSDNVPGVPGVGEKTATKLIIQYKSVQGVYEHLDEMKNGKVKTSLEENKELALLSRKLVEICADCPIEFDLEKAKIGDFYTNEAYKLFQELEFKNMLSRFGEKQPAFSIQEHMETIQGLDKIEAVFERACKEDWIAMHVIGDGCNVLAAVVGFVKKDQIYYMAADEYQFVSSEYLADNCKKICKVVKNTVVFDLKEWLQYFGEEFPKEAWENILDAGLLAYLNNPLKDVYGYEEIAKEFAGCYLPSRADYLKKMDIESAYKENPDEVRAYAGTLVFALMHSIAALKESVSQAGMLSLYYDVEFPLAVSLYRMEQAGMRVEKEELRRYGEELGEQITLLQKKIYESAEQEFNINSPKQLGELLFDKLKLPFAKKTKTGYSTSADILEKLKGEHEIIPYILEYRQLAKLKSTYADGLILCIKEDGKIHSTFNQKVTATGRISSTEPNLQNIPVRMEMGRKIRKVFVPEEGFVFVDADYSQIELRVLAHMSGDEKMIEAFRSNVDIHTLTASEVFHVPMEEVTSLQRRNAKAVNFGIVYGISAFGLSQDIGTSRKEAAEFIEKYFATYPKIKDFLDKLVENGKKDGYVSSLFSRRRPVPELHSSNFMTRSFGERVAMNAPIQGTAADIIKIAMIRVDQRMAKEGLKARLVLQVHDELLIEAPKQEKETVRKILQEEMEHAAELNVKLDVDIHTAKNWYEVKG